jgi:hypothetical protein
MNYASVIKYAVTLCAAFIAVAAQGQNKKPNVLGQEATSSKTTPRS